jgi:hypothetical protein
MAEIKPYMTTGIGSLPHRSAEEAVEAALSLDIPFWPQLPSRSFLEQMIPQYAEGMPGFRLDAGRESFHVERDPEAIDRFYETSGEGAKIAISEDFAKGFYAFCARLKGRRLPFAKGHITGPLTFTLGLKDDAGRLVYYDEELREISLMLLAAKARWQVSMLKQFADEVVIFIDEPILSALGSTAYLGVSPDETERLLSEAARAIREAGAITGIHCCGRADWPLVLRTGVDIMNMDMFDYGETLAIYPAETTAFLEQGGILAWGIVPTTEAISGVDEESIRALFHARMDMLSEHIPANLLRQGIILTPSCGTGSRSVEESTRIFQLLMHLRESLV